MFFQQILNGFAQGSMYALIAVGFALILGTLRLVSFAHGELVMLGGFAAFTIITLWKGPLWMAVLAAILFSGTMGVLIELVGFRLLRRTSPISSLLVTIGFSIVLLNLAQMIWGAETRSFPTGLVPGFLELFGLQVSTMQFAVYGVSIGIIICLQYILRHTKIGWAIRATAQDHEAAFVLGININRVYSITYGLGSALGGLGGLMVGIYYNAVFPGMGSMLGLKAFSACILGGLTSISGSFFAGIFLGVIENLSVAYISSGARHIFSFALLILMLILKPSGLFGKEVRTKL